MSNELAVKTPTENVLGLRRDLEPKDINDGAISKLDRAALLVHPAAHSVAKGLREINGRPPGDRIFVLPLPKDERFGSIHFPEIAQEDNQCGIVVAVGRGHYENGCLIPPEVEPGNYISYARYAARDVEIGKVKVHQISECDITFICSGPAEAVDETA